MATYKTPDVYIKEISIFPPSVAEVETAIPAFIGYTEKADMNGEDLTNKPTKIKSLLEYSEYFGSGSSPGSIEVDLDSNNNPLQVTISPKYYLYNSLRLFFDNGGGNCYIVSVGDYESNNTIQLGDTTDSSDYGFLFGIQALEKYDEPTILLFPDAVLLSSASDLYALQQQALAQCEKLQDRVTVFDLLESRSTDINFDVFSGVDEFRNSIGVNNLKYGAVYVPYLKSNIPYSFSFADITAINKGGAPVNLEDLTPLYTSVIEDLNSAIVDKGIFEDFIDDYNASGSILDQYESLAGTGKTNIENKVTFINTLAEDLLGLTALTNSDLDAKLADLRTAGTNPDFGKLETVVRTLFQYDSDYYSGTLAAASADPLGIVVPGTDFPAYDASGIAANTAANTIYNTSGTPGNNATSKATNAAGPLRSLFEKLLGLITDLYNEIAEYISNKELNLTETNSIYANIVTAITNAGTVIPPSGAVAGVYAKIDDTRGVWKAPANVSLNSVKGTTEVIDFNDQKDLNVDTNGGKSINAIRTFTGRGIMIWGARTLAGNDNEWRYISVRRFFNMVEESVKKSTYWAVFEPNDANTWVKIKGMIENYLTQKWRDGALAGATPEEAFFVKVGLGLTMTAQDILEGRMNVEIGMAAVRPTEFIILKFSHKMQES